MERKLISCCLVLCWCLSHVRTILGKEEVGPLRLEPNYNPFFVQLGAPFSITCVKDTRRSCVKGKDAPCGDIDVKIKDEKGGSQHAVSILWSVNGDPAESWGFGTQQGTRVLRGGSGTTVRSYARLTKDMVSLGDIVPGGLLCHTEDSVDGREEGEELFVSVNFFNVLIESPNITEGDDVNLRCAPDTSAKITWSRDGHVIDDITPRRRLQDGNRTLVLVDSHPRDSGMYQCTVKVEADFDRHSNETKVQTFIQNISVAGRPYLTEPVTLQVTTVLNGSFTLRCPVRGHPPPGIFWLHPGDQPVAPSPRLNFTPYQDLSDAVLTVSAVTKDDLGFYYCVAKNGVGEWSKEFHVGMVNGAGLSLHQIFNAQGFVMSVMLIGLSVAALSLASSSSSSLLLLLKWDLC